MSKYTAFVAVTQDVRVDPNDNKLQNLVPVLTPNGMLPQAPTPNATVPEPSQVLGNLLAVISLGIYFAWKRLK